MIYTDAGFRTLTTIPLDDIAAGEVVRGIIDQRPISGRPVTVISCEFYGTGKVKKMKRRQRVYRVKFTYPNGNPGERFLFADRTVAVER